MKIAICINSCVLGGVTNSTTILYHGFKSQGYDVKIIVTSHEKGDYYDANRASGVAMEAVADGVLWLKRRLDNTYDAIKDFDVVLCNHSLETWLLLPLLPDNMVKISIVRGVTKNNIRHALYNSEYLDALVGVSPVVKDLLAAKSKCRVLEVVPNAVMAYATELTTLGKKIHIVFLGRISQSEKNILILPEVIRLLSNEGVSFDFEIVGDGPDLESLKARLEKYGVLQHVHFCGKLGYRDAAQRLQQADFLVMPSNHESFGLVLAEAMALGTVPIVSPLAVFSWILGEAKKDLQVKQNTANQYVRIIKRLCSHPEEYYSLQQKLVRRQRTVFTPDKTVRRYSLLMERLLHDKQPKHQVLPFRRCKTNNSYFPIHYRVRCTKIYYLFQRLSLFFLKNKRSCFYNR